ncbi:uncharacterized protein LOC143913753 [Arctopsyche grandis]|uniref:uncharacterized protein LOC143913753 n=1 Tax=Arctopsyche grandis TaxID=121162 RepID=UPI00406D9D46
MLPKSNFMILAIIISLASADDSKQNDNTTQISKNISTTIPPKEDMTDTICKTCECKNAVINCSDQAILTFFTVADWAGVKEKEPKKIDLSYNNFTNVTKLGNLSTLNELNLSHGNIRSIEKGSFKDLQNMQVLDLSYNSLSSIELSPDVFVGVYIPEQYLPLRSLRVLKLSYNDLHSLHQDLFEHLPEVIELRLNGNPFKVIDHVTVVSISSLSLLKILDLSDCQLKSLPEYFLHTPRYLEWLDLSSNQLQNVPEPLGDAQSLNYLNISNNPIKYIEHNSTVYTPFLSMPNLQELHMCNMSNLVEIKARSMSGLTGLTKLYLHNNPALTKIHSTTFESHDKDGEGEYWPPIVELYLERNNLSVIDNGLLGRWDRLEHIDIRHNPFLCDCTTQWMVGTLATIILKKSSNMTSDIICNEPIEMRGKSMIHLEEIHSRMRCSDTYGNRPERDATMLVGTLIGALIAVPIILGIILIYKRGYFSVCGAGGPAAFTRTFYKRTDTNDFL